MCVITNGPLPNHRFDPVYILPTPPPFSFSAVALPLSGSFSPRSLTESLFFLAACSPVAYSTQSSHSRPDALSLTLFLVVLHLVQQLHSSSDSDELPAPEEDDRHGKQRKQFLPTFYLICVLSMFPFSLSVSPNPILQLFSPLVLLYPPLICLFLVRCWYSPAPAHC